MEMSYINYTKYKNKIKRIYYEAFPKNERFPFWVLQATNKDEKADTVICQIEN